MGSLLDGQVQKVHPSDLKLHPKNARQGDVAAIAESLKRNQQFAPIVVQLSTGFVLAGNHTLKAARELAWETIDAVYVDVDDDQAHRIMLAANRTADRGGYDDRLLLELLADLDDLDGTGYNEDDLDALVRSVTGDQDGDTPPADEDDIPTPPAGEPISQLGDVWYLGDHRLVVGDATDPDVIRLACNDTEAELILTDPPYNVAYLADTHFKPKQRKDGLTIVNDAMSTEKFREFLTNAFTAMYANAIPGAPIYVFYSSTEEVSLRQALTATGWLYKQTLIWVKQAMVLSRQDYHWQHEPILYGWKPGAAHRWYGTFTPTTLLDDQKPISKMTKEELADIVQGFYSQSTAIRADRPFSSTDHPTSKPVALLTRLLENSSRWRGLVLDPFAGSGSTLIAAHQAGRRAALVELDPKFADVICRRYQLVTGDLPIRAADLEPVDFAGDEVEQ